MDLGASAGAGAGDHSRSGSAAPKSASKAHLSAKARHSAAAATSGAASSPSGQPLPAQQTFKARQNLQMGGRALGAVSSSITGSRDLDGDRKEAIRHVRSEDLAELDEAYLMKDTIGQGAFGIVKLCEHKATGKVYACKIVKKRIGSTSSYEQLQREVNIMKAVHHPNIVQLKEVIESPKKMCMVMDCGGGELVQTVRKRGSCSEPEIRMIVLQLLEAVTYLHRHGIVHRDIKPENILLKSNHPSDLYNIKVSDFGLACFADSVNRVDNIAGTPMYMAPEIVQNLGYNHSCDIWSIGVMFYLLLNHYQKEVEMVVQEMIKSGKIEYPDRFWSKINPAARNLCELILRFDPAKRISAAEILRHPWTLDQAMETCQLNANVLDLMKSYNAERRFRRGIICVMAYLRFMSPVRATIQPLSTAASSTPAAAAAHPAPGSQGAKQLHLPRSNSSRTVARQVSLSSLANVSGHQSASVSASQDGMGHDFTSASVSVGHQDDGAVHTVHESFDEIGASARENTRGIHAPAHLAEPDGQPRASETTISRGTYLKPKQSVRDAPAAAGSSVSRGHGASNTRSGADPAAGRAEAAAGRDVEGPGQRTRAASKNKDAAAGVGGGGGGGGGGTSGSASGPSASSSAATGRDGGLAAKTKKGPSALKTAPMRPEDDDCTAASMSSVANARRKLAPGSTAQQGPMSGGGSGGKEPSNPVQSHRAIPSHVATDLTSIERSSPTTSDLPSLPKLKLPQSSGLENNDKLGGLKSKR